MKKFLAFPIECAVIAVLALLLAAPPASFAQDHVVSATQLQQAIANATALRQQNRGQLESFLSSAQARKAMESAHINYKQVDRAISQLSDSELSMLVQRTANTQKDFAAGAISTGKVILIVIGTALLILLLVAVA